MFGIMLTVVNSGKGWHSHFFCQEPRTAASTENVSRPITDLQRGQILIGIYCRKKNNWRIFFSGPAASRCFKACLYKASREKSKNWLRRTNIKSNLTPKLECILKRSNYDANPWFLHLIAQKSKCPRRFWEIDPEILHTCLMCPCRAYYECLFFRRKCGIP